MRHVAQLGRQGVVGLFFMAGAVLAAMAADDPALEGCWRTQQTRRTLADGTQSDQNADCVIERAAGQAHARCHTRYKEIDSTSTYEVTGPGRLRTTLIDSASGQPKGEAAPARYSVQGDWLMLDVDVPAANVPASIEPGKRPVRAQSVNIRVKSKSACQPRGDSAIRIGDTPVSSLALQTPEGWHPHRVDPAYNESMRLMVGKGFLIGAFFPVVSPRKDGPTLIVVTDDTTSDPKPAHAAEIATLKKWAINHYPAAQLACDQPEHVCLSITLPEGLIYTEFFTLNGRIVRVGGPATHPSSDSQRLMRQAVQTFVEQLRKDNMK